MLKSRSINNLSMVKLPKISAAFIKRHGGEDAISVNGRVIATGRNGLIALKKAKKIDPNIEKKDFLLSRIYRKYIAA